MTDLRVSWVNATRSLYGSPEAAKQYHDLHYAQHQSPATKWVRLTSQATYDATLSLLPSERRLACFVVTFVPSQRGPL